MPTTVGRRHTRLSCLRRLINPRHLAHLHRRLLDLHRLIRGTDRRTLLQLSIVGLVSLACWHAIDVFGRPYNFFDMKIYHGAMVWWASGRDLYEFVAPQTTLGFTYPPFAGLLMLPMIMTPVSVAGWFTALAGIATLTVVLAALLRPIAQRLGCSLWFAVGIAVPLAVALEPVRETLGYGQVNILLFGLIMADLIALRWQARGGRRTVTAASPLRRFLESGVWAGAGIGLATSIKLTPALFIVHLLITRQWRAALTAIGTVCGVTTLAFLIAEQDSAAYFTNVLWQTDRVGAADMTPNQSLAGLLARLYDSIETPGLLWFTFAMLMLAVGLSRAANAHADGDELTAFTLVGLTANVISPISWTHHLVFVIPAIVVLADATIRRRGASRLLNRTTPITPLPQQVAGLRSPIWFPGLTGLRHLLAALGLYLVFLISPIWPYEHQLPEESHYQDGLFGALMENSLAIALIVLVAALPWRPGAEPTFRPEQARLGRLHRAVTGS